MEQQIKELRKQVEEALQNVKDKNDLANFWQNYLSKKGSIPNLMKGLGSVAKEARPTIGKLINEFRDEVTKQYEKIQTVLEEKELEERNKTVPLKGGAGDAWDTANAALFLASDEAKFITGASLPVDGGALVCGGRC